MIADSRSVKVGGEVSYCTIVVDFRLSLSDFGLTVLYGQADSRRRRC
jgi:hypothetical protein